MSKILSKINKLFKKGETELQDPLSILNRSSIFEDNRNTSICWGYLLMTVVKFLYVNFMI